MVAEDLGVDDACGEGVEYSQGQPLATVVDFSTGGTHEISLRIRKKVGIPKLRHGTEPDGRGLSAITVLPIE